MVSCRLHGQLISQLHHRLLNQLHSQIQNDYVTMQMVLRLNSAMCGCPAGKGPDLNQ